jgi:single-stranded-DNA-specific exonuclease
LIGVSNIRANKISTSDIGFILAPRLNAAGRIDSATLSLELLLEKDPMRCSENAQKLNNLNISRRELSKQIQIKAEELILAEDPNALLFLAVLEDCEPNVMGVVGLSASDLQKKYYRPAIIGYKNEKYTRASCRSIPEFNIIQALDECADLFEKHGGHAAAAGFTIRNERFPELKERLMKIAQRELALQELVPTLYADAEINLNQIQAEELNELLADLANLQPTGQNNPKARFVSREVKVETANLLGKEKNHLKLEVSGGRNTYKAIAFQQADWYARIPPIVDLFYILEYDDFSGNNKIQFNVKDIKPAASYR